ncbi:MAG: MFS transporter [Alphaproteobacteria bacterium]|nr:MFS transporter [Alphaproteobacteria bacterium]
MSIPASTPTPAAPATTRWPLVLLLVGAGVVSAFQIGKAPAALPILRAELGMSLPQAAWVISIFNVIGIAAGMALGAIAERLGHRRAALCGLLIIAIASAAGGATNGAAGLLATRFAEGLGFMIVVVATPALLVRAAAARDIKLAFGFWATYMPTGTAAMMTIAPAIIAGAGWRGLWLANAGLVLLFAAMLAAATRAMVGTAPARGGVLDDMVATLRAPGPRLLALTFATYTLQFLAVFGLLPTLRVEQDGVSPGRAALLGSAAVAINIPGNLLGGWIVHRGAPRWLVVAGVSAAMGVCALLIYSAGLTLPLRYALCLLLSLVGGMLPAVVLGAGPSFAPSPRHLSTTNGLIMQGSNLGQVIGPPAVAAVAAGTGGWSGSPLVLTTSALLGVALALRMRRLERR